MPDSLFHYRQTIKKLQFLENDPCGNCRNVRIPGPDDRRISYVNTDVKIGTAIGGNGGTCGYRVVFFVFYY